MNCEECLVFFEKLVESNCEINIDFIINEASKYKLNEKNIQKYAKECIDLENVIYKKSI